MTDPLRLSHISRLALIAGVLVVCWGGLVSEGGDRLTAKRIAALVETQGTLIAEHADALSYNLHRSLAFLHALPGHFAADDDVMTALRNAPSLALPPDADVNAKAAIFLAHPDLIAISRYLARESERFGIDVTWVVNTAGDCIAASHFDRPESFVGTNYHDRDYFRMPMAGQPGHQFAVGYKTSIPGIFFSAPVMEDGRVLGAVVIKVDMDKLSPLLGSADSFVTDEYGVVIMARRPALYMRALPENQLARLSPEARLFRYKQRDFQPLSVTPWNDLPTAQAIRFEGSAYPYLITTRAESAEGMTVHVISPLEAIGEINHGAHLLKIAVFIAGTTLLLLAVGILLYLRNSARHVRELRDKQVALEAAKRRAEAATEAKAQFLANMSHEIRTPMNGVLGLTHLVKSTKLTPQQRDYLNKIEMSATALLDIINDILDLSKIDGGKLVIESVEFKLDAVFDHVCNVSASRVVEKGIELLFRIGPGVPKTLIGDPLRLRQVLLNLTGNAVKFTERGEVVLSVDVTDRTEGRVTLTFSVRDTGIGMTAEQQEKLFQDFSQADESITRRFGGTGLGLSISKQLVGLMGGTIGARSQPGAGSTFSFTIPFTVGMEAREEAVLSPQLKDLRVLVVDDNPTACLVGTTFLIDCSMHVEPASSGQGALEKIQQADALGRPFDLVVMDWRMPGLDGLQAARLIMENETLTRRPTVIMVTAYGDEDLRSLASAVGVSAVLTKPFSPSQLFDCVASLFGGNGGSSPSPPDVGGHAIPTTSHRLRGLHILVVEDNAINRQIAVELLGRVGIKVDIAENGREAADIVLHGGTTYDAVLMDVQMPVMDGLTATGMIREQYNRGALPIIAMTAHAMEHERKRCLDAGMNDHVVKPVDPKHLYETLERWVMPHGPAPKDGTAAASDGGAGAPAAFDIESLFDEPKPAATRGVLPEDLPPFDLTKALERVAGDPDLLKMLIICFRESFAEAGAEMRRLIEGQNLEEAYRLAHTIKGAAGSLDATSLFLAARDLEQALRPVDLEILRTAFETTLAEALSAAATVKEDSPHGSEPLALDHSP
jgi:signal transduction histidine kinase/CheY-like chemotaxis protein